MNRKNICFFIGNISNSGGTERVTSLIANELISRGYNITILSLYAGGASYFSLDPKIKLHSLFIKNVNMKLYYLHAIFRLRKFVKIKKVDILIDVDSILSVFSVPALSLLKTKHICWEHFNYNFDLGVIFRRWGRKLAAQYCDYVVTLTERDKKLWENNLKKINAQIVAINNPSPYQNIASTPDIKNKLVLAVGRLADQKGFDLLLAAWGHVTQKKPDWKLNIVGNGDRKDQLLKQIDELNLNEVVSIIPTTNNIEQYYKKASIYCLSSRFEGFPMVLLEAQAYGLPIVAFDCDTGPAELIEDNDTGYLVAPLNINELANKLNNMMNINDYAYKKMSHKAKENSNRYRVDNIVTQWEPLINSEVLK